MLGIFLLTFFYQRCGLGQFAFEGAEVLGIEVLRTGSECLGAGVQDLAENFGAVAGFKAGLVDGYQTLFGIFFCCRGLAFLGGGVRIGQTPFGCGVSLGREQIHAVGLSGLYGLLKLGDGLVLLLDLFLAEFRVAGASI